MAPSSLNTLLKNVPVLSEASWNKPGPSFLARRLRVEPLPTAVPSQIATVNRETIGGDSV